MLEPHAPEIRRELAADRVTALREAARGSGPGPVRRAIGNVVVRLGVLLGGDRTVSPAARRESYPEALASAGVSSFPSRRAPADGATGRTTGGSKPLAAKASTTASATWVCCWTGTSATAEPPNPPPVILAPSAPAAIADSTATSSSAQEIS